MQQLETKTDKRFIDVYKPLMNKFVSEVNILNNIDNLPEPFIPVYGDYYDASPYKFAFVGWETRNNSSLKCFIESFNDVDNECLYSFKEDLFPNSQGDFKFNYYGNNFGRTFWDFILKFLARFYGYVDWKTLKEYSNHQVAKILQSFIWGNVDSIERFEATTIGDEKRKDKSAYNKVKQASLVFDNCSLLIQALEPKVIIVTHWSDDESWLTNDINSFSGPEKLTDYIWYYHLTKSDTHIFWTKHPIELSTNSISFENSINIILKSINSKNIYNDFPGVSLLKALEDCKTQFKELSHELGLNIKFYPSEQEFGEGESSAYFHKEHWKTGIGFGFEKSIGKDFFYGVCKKDNNLINNSTEMINIFGVEQNELPTNDWPSWFWVKEHRNWNIETYNQISEGIFIENIKNKIKAMMDKIDKYKIEM